MMFFKNQNFFTSSFRLLLIVLFFISHETISQHILIAYYSRDGHTEKMARAVEEGAQVTGKSVVRVKTVQETMEADLLWADAVIVGSPVHDANMAAPVQEFITLWPFDTEGMKDKLGAAFVTGGGISAGEEIVQLNILHAMLVHRMIVLGGPSWTQPFGASGITGEDPFKDDGEEAEVDDQFLEKGRALGRRVAEVAGRMVE